MVMILARGLYVLKRSGDAWSAKLVESLMPLGQKLSEADSDVWMKRDFKPNGYLYYKYILFYADDLLHIVFKPKEDTDALNMIYWLK